MLVAGTQTDRTQMEAESQSAPGPDAEEPIGDSPSQAVEEKPAPPAASLEERVRRLEDIIATLHLAPPSRDHVTTHAETPPSDGIVANPRPGMSAIKGADPAPFPPPPLLPSRGEPWLPFEIYAELRAMLRMYFDPRYRMSLYSRLLIPLLIIGIVLTRMMIASVPLIGWLLDIVLFPILLYVLIKVLIREATRYRSTSPDLPPTLRL